MPPLGAVNHDEVDQDAGLDHRLHHGEKFMGIAYAQFDPDRFAARKFAHPASKFDELDRRGKGAVSSGGEAIFAHGHVAGLGDFARHLGRWQ